MTEIVNGLTNPSTWWGALILSVIASFVYGYLRPQVDRSVSGTRGWIQRRSKKRRQDIAVRASLYAGMPEMIPFLLQEEQSARMQALYVTMLAGVLFLVGVGLLPDVDAAGTRLSLPPLPVLSATILSFLITGMAATSAGAYFWGRADFLGAVRREVGYIVARAAARRANPDVSGKAKGPEASD